MRCFGRRLGILTLVLALSVSIMPLLAPVSAEVSADGWGTQPSGVLLSLYSVSGTSPSNVVASGDAGLVLRYDGSAWNPMSTGVVVPLYGIWAVPTGEVYAVGNAGTIVRHNGVSWSQMASGSSNHLNAIWGSAANDVFAVGNVGTILHYNGVSWSTTASGVTSHLRGVWGSSATDVFAAGNGGVILHYDGISWVSMDSSTRSKLYAIWGTAADGVMAVGDGGTIVRYDGASWSGVNSGVTASLNGIWGASANDVFVVGAGGLILHYDGVWRSMSSGTGNTLYGIWGASPFNVYAVGTLGTILHYRDTAPDVTSVQPGQAYQGETLTTTISGSNLQGTTLVDFGSGVTVTGFQVNTGGTQIAADIAVDAAAVPGARDVSVTTPTGTDTLGAAFTIQVPPPVPPVLTSVAPASGLCGQALSVFITGSNLDGTTLVSFGPGVSVISFQVDAGGAQIAADITIDAAAVPGPRDVSVTTPAGTDTLSSAFTVQSPPPVPPVLASVAPVSGVCGQSLVSTITGTNLNGATAVDFGSGVTVTGFQVNTGGTQITANIVIDAAATPGFRDVSVTTPAGTDTLAGAFTVQLPPPVPPVLTSVTPVSGICGQNLVATIAGTNLNGASVVSFGVGVNVTAFQVNLDGSQITANISIDAAAALGARNVSVTTPAGTDTLSNAFTVQSPPPTPPVLTSVAPASGVCGQNLVVVITGVNLTGASVASFGAGVNVTSFQVNLDGTHITANINIDAAAIPGTRDVSVTTPAGTGTLSNAFNVQSPPPAPPVLASVAPLSGVCGQAMAIVITGTNLNGASVVSFGTGVTVSGFQVSPDGTQITTGIIIDAAAVPGARDVSVTTIAGSDTLATAFTVQLPPKLPPVLTSVAPGSGVSGQAMTVVITGTDLNGTTTVDFGDGVSVSSFQVNLDGTQMTADIVIDAAAAPGTRDITVTTVAGTNTPEVVFTVLIPFSYVVEVSPKTAMIGETVDIVISGEKLESVIAIDFGPGIDVNSFSVDGPDRISARITIRQDAKAGYRDVSIVTLWSTYSQLEGFAVKAVPPSLGSISDIDGKPGDVMTVTIQGANLVGVTRVSFGPGVEVQGFDMYPPESLRVRISISED